ncbi:putative membrane protein [Candidatus Methanophagaceae archaeon]|nr:putative membrane protein [Methanophagales archaeon]
MKKKTNGILVGLIVITVLFGVLAPVQAQIGVPFTIVGQVVDTDGTTPVDGVTMTVTDLETNSTLNTEITENGGWYSMNLGNLKPDSTHNAGDIIRIHADDGAGKTNTTEVPRAETDPQWVNVTLEGGVQPVLTTIEVTPSTATVNVDATQEFTATAKDQDGNVMSGVVINWTSSNETVGTIDAGVFTAKVNGTTTVMAANGTVNGTAAVTVQEVVPQNLTITNLEADPNTGVNKDNPTTVSATITSSAALELVTLYAIDTETYQPKQYALYADDILIVAGDDYSAEWDATEFKVKNETTSSGKPVFVGKTARWDTTTYYGVSGNLTINATSGTAFAVALFNTGDLKLSEIIEPLTKESYSVEPGTTTFAPFAMDASDRDSIIDPFVLLGNLEPLDAVTLTGAAPDYGISLEKTQVPPEDYVVGLAALDKAGDKDYNETTVSVSTTEYEVSISADTTEKTVAPNVTATYTLTVENEGTKADNYTLSLESNAAVAELDIENITIEAGKTQEVSLNVSDASTGTYTVNVTVKSQTVTNVTDMVSTLTTVKVAPTPTPTPTPAPRRRGGGGGGGGVSDSDGDGYSDIDELIAGTDPYDPCDPNPTCIACIGEAIISEVITTPKPTPYDPTKGITPPTTKPVATIPPLEKEPEEPEKEPGVPGFEVVFAIAGLLAVAYLVQRRKK